VKRGGHPIGLFGLFVFLAFAACTPSRQALIRGIRVASDVGCLLFRGYDSDDDTVHDVCVNTDLIERAVLYLTRTRRKEPMETGMDGGLSDASK
jgi:hypothetical protein